jgi:phage gp36-like protein
MRARRHAGRASELSTFSLRFDGSAQQVNATLQGALELKLCAAMACARQMVHPAATAPFAQHEPAQTAQFAEDVGPLVALSSALLLYQSAVVTSAARPAFEAGAAASAARTNDTALAAQLAFGINDVFPTVLPAGPPHRAPAAEYHLPMLHVSPMTPLLSAFIMYDTRAASNLPERHVALETAVRTGRPAWSDILGSTVLTPAGGFAPSNQVVVPVLSPGAQSGGVNTTLGTCTLLFDWSSVLKSVLPGFVTSVTAVLTSFSGRQATFQLRDGVVAIVGLGDLHDARFNAYKRVAVANAGGATWQVALYPTQVLVDSYLTAAPLRNAIIIAVVVSLCCAVFAHYELHVRRRANAMNLLLRRNLEELGRLKAEEQRLMEAGIKQQDQFVSVSARLLRCSLQRHRC